MRRPEISDDAKAVMLKVGGLLLFVIALIAFLSCISFLFTWKADQSLLSDPSMMDRGVEVHNTCGKLGFKTGNALVSGFLGLGIFVLTAFLFETAYSMFFRKMPQNAVRKSLLYVSGALLVSFLLAFVSGMFGADTAFSGGLGGRVGYGLNASFVNALGFPGTALVLAFCVVLWLVFANRRFAAWLSVAFEKKNPVPAVPAAPAVQTTGCTAVQATGDTAGEADAPQTRAAGAVATVAEPPAEPGSGEADVQTGDPDEHPDGTAGQENMPAVEPAETPADGEGSGSGEAVQAESPAEGTAVEIIDGIDLTKPVEDLPPLDVKADLENYKVPTVDLLDDYTDQIRTVSRFEVETNNARIRTTLESYKIQVDSVTAIVGPTVTLYKVKLAPGVKSALVKSVEKDIAMALGNESVRVTILADAVGIEVANETKSIVPLKAMFNDPSFRESKAELPVAIGYTITQKVKTFDLADTPHLLIAGATKQGKSVGLNVIVASLLYAKHPSELKFVFVDPKMVEFTAYKRLLKHYLAAMPSAVSEEDEEESVIVKDHKKADEVLRSLCIEMDDRYLLLSKAGVNKLKDYNDNFIKRHLRPDQGHRFMPYLVVVIDEYADLIMAAGSDQRSVSKSVTSSIIRLAQKGRAAGIHVIIATQRPTVDVITGLIKANFPTRIAFRVVSRTDSGTILDTPGAEKLIGRGDMLYYEGIKLERVQCAYVSSEEINNITKFIGAQQGFRQHYGTPYYLPELPVEAGDGEGGSAMVDMHRLDSNFEEAARLVVTYQKGSTSDIQRRLGMGYARAGKVMDQLEAAGIVGPQEGSKPRQVLVSTLDELEPILQAFLKQ